MVRRYLYVEPDFETTYLPKKRSGREQRLTDPSVWTMDQLVLPNSSDSDNCENERTTVLYMKVETTFLSLNVESIMGLILEVDRIGLSHGEAV